MNLDKMLDLALNASKAALRAILKERERLQIWTKADGSPLSSADLAANEALCEILARSDLKICSEEKPLDYAARKDLSAFWLIDPLDGTKGFLKGSDEFCVLVALIEHGRPILSVLSSPKAEFYAHKHTKVFKNGEILTPSAAKFTQNRRTALISVHHPNPQNQAFLDKNALTPRQISSAMKFAALLDGEAGIYHRFESLNGWDIAAGDFLINQNGGFMGALVDLNSKNAEISSSLNFKNAEFSSDLNALNLQDAEFSNYLNTLHSQNAKISSSLNSKNSQNAEISSDLNKPQQKNTEISINSSYKIGDFINYNAPSFRAPPFIAVAKREFLDEIL